MVIVNVHVTAKKNSKPSQQELVKESSHGLKGTIAAELVNGSDKFQSSDASLLKFHGAYQQDDRDARQARSPEGSKPARKHTFMVRTRIPGGRMTASQMLDHLDLCDRFGDGTLRITTRQGLQLYGVVMGDLKQTISGINETLLTTLGACGDVVRNVMCCPAPHHEDPVRNQMHETAAEIAKHFSPQTPAYHTIWVDGEKHREQRPREVVEPLYGTAYLPRKFKMGIALPDDNCVDVYTQDVGLLAVVENQRLVGYNVLVGGGLGKTPSAKDTFPRLADPIAFVSPGDTKPVLEAIVKVQRDHGNRENRRLARMKYLVDSWGISRFKEKVEEYLGGERLAAPRDVTVRGVCDHLGWREQHDGKYYFGQFIENGRIKDEGSLRLKTSLRKLLNQFQVTIRLTAQQSLLICDIKSEWRDSISQILRESGIKPISNVRRHSMACPALPTCGLAITESERALPDVITRLQAEIARLGLANEVLTVRMTGCPNGCTRPYTADIGLVGKAVGKYTILLGGGILGTRLNRVFMDMVPLEGIVDELLPVLTRFKVERLSGETFGDFCERTDLLDKTPPAAEAKNAIQK